MMGGNAFLRLTSSVVAGALILNQVARAQDSCAQDCVKTYEGCGSCEDPNLRLLTVVQPNFGGGGGLGGGGLRPPPEVLGEGELCIGAGLKVLQSLTFKYTICASEPSGYGISGQDLPPNAITLEGIERDIAALSGTLDGGLGDTTSYLGAGDYVSVVSFPCMTDSSQVRVDFGGFQPTSSGINRVGVFFPRLEKVRFANLKTMGAINVRTTYIALIRNYLISSSFSAIENTVSVTIPRIGCCLRGSSSSGLFLLKIP